MKKRTAAVLAAFLIPYITTLAVSGRVQGADGGKIGGNSDRTSGWESQTDGRKRLQRAAEEKPERRLVIFFECLS